MSDPSATSKKPTGLSKERLEALTDGIFGMAMTLLVIELKVPDHANVRGPSELAQSVLRQIPAFTNWILSFFVLTVYWVRHHRLFHYVGAVDSKVLWLNVFYLSLVSLMPFSSALVGEYRQMVLSQCFYSSNMILLSLFGLLQHRYVFRHPELWERTLTIGVYRAARFRSLGLVVVALVAVGIATFAPGWGNAAFTLMVPIMILSRRLEGSPAITNGTVADPGISK